MDVSLVISSLSLVVSVTAIVATYFINRKVDSDNTKRKEFNELAEPIIEYLEQMEVYWRSDGNYVFSAMYWEPRVAKIKRRLTTRQAKKLDGLIRQFNEAFNTASTHQDAMTCAVLVKCSERLRNYLKVR
ncbi:hypothetical protein [Serratia aquatilis]|uniref:DUF4760 domain-containing protein n=1 Tax=Serratia aquatilis TaxID=1737515 RepID=A0ABV6E9M9_9GAMM